MNHIDIDPTLTVGSIRPLFFLVFIKNWIVALTGRGERVEKLAKCPNFLNNFAQPTVHNGLKVSKVFTYLQKAPKVFFSTKKDKFWLLILIGC